jgi:hypothetical protein
MALSIVRIVSFSQSELVVLFSEALSADLGIENVTIEPTTVSVPGSSVSSVVVEDDTLTITYRPIFDAVKYKVTFFSTDTRTFASAAGERLTEDGARNVLFVVATDAGNAYTNNLIDKLADMYNVSSGSTVTALSSSTAEQLQRCAEEVQTVRAANYLSIPVVDERVVRGPGPTDPLANGGAYEVTRVAISQTGTVKYAELALDSAREASFNTRVGTVVNDILATIPSDPISLQAVDVFDEDVSDDTEQNNYFAGLSIRVDKGPVIQLVSLFLKRGAVYTAYDIKHFGYTLGDNYYDTRYAGKNVNLGERDIELSVNSITGLPGGFIVPQPGDTVIVSYVHKNLGRGVDETTVELNSVKESVREQVYPLLTKFTLAHAPIVSSSDVEITMDGVTFHNTQPVGGNPAFTTDHPAFTRELEFDLARLPQRPGEYAVNYATGEVYVFGEDATNAGTGNAPPAATYYYRKVYVSDVDYTYDPDTSDLAVKSTRDLIGLEAKISFEYEDVFTPGTDYQVLAHVESIAERIDNRIVSEFDLQTAHAPITNVFRVFNETTGEIYTIERFNDTTVTFSGRKAPQQVDVVRERAEFARVTQEALYVAEESLNAYSNRVLKIALAHSGVTDSTSNYLGANFDTSITLSDPTIFVTERFYEDQLFQDAQTNQDRLKDVGDYCVDYANGIIYVAVSTDQGADLGDITYNYSSVETRNKHILKANDLYRANGSTVVQYYTPGQISDTLVPVMDMGYVGERFLDGDPTRPLIVGTVQSGKDAVVFKGSNYFDSVSGVFDSSFVGLTLTVGSVNRPPIEQKTITTIVNTHQVLTDTNFTSNNVGVPWVVVDDTSRDLTVAHDILYVKSIYKVGQLGQEPLSRLDGYYNEGADTFSGNVISLGTSNVLEPGDAVMVNYNYGDLQLDYRYLRDELLVSYEYGNNRLNWNLSSALKEGEEYFVSYKYGALRDTLLSNFGVLTQIPQLTSFSTDFERETYRSVLQGTIQSFIEGPTKRSMERLVESFTGVRPEINESAFDMWALGRDYLYAKDLYIKNSTYAAGKFGSGLLVDSDQVVSLPAISHLRLREGTIESWVRPSWNGVANDATVTFDLLKNGTTIGTGNVFIGAFGTNPDQVPFDLSTADLTAFGTPINLGDSSATGYFVWYDEPNKQWNLKWKDGYVSNSAFTGTIESSGEFYEVSSAQDVNSVSINEVNDELTTAGSSIEFTAAIDGYDGYEAVVPQAFDGITFKSGDLHYLFDTAISEDRSRISIYKDAQGHMCFRIVDSGAINGKAKIYKVSSSVVDWDANDAHHVAVSWRIGSDYERDEMHLFLDGQEVPNAFRFGGVSAANARFRDPAEEVAIAAASRPIVGGFDGTTTAASALFRSTSMDFEALGVQVGDTLYLLDDTVDGNGTSYGITGVGGNSILLASAPTLSLGSVSFSVNQAVIAVDSPVNLQDFLVVARNNDGDTELYGQVATEPDYSVRRSGTTQYLVVNNGVAVGDAVVVKTLGLVLEGVSDTFYVYSDTDELKASATEPTDLSDVRITKVLLPSTAVQDDGYISLVTTYAGPDPYVNLAGVFTGFATSTSNTTKGRRLSVNLSGSNVDFSTAFNYVTLNGTTFSGITQETMTFTANGTYTTTEYWRTLDSITISLTPVDVTLPAAAFELREFKMITEAENNGDYAEVFDYYNGRFQLETYGSGGLPFMLNPGWYSVKYPTYMTVHFDRVPETMYLGCSFDGANQFDGVLDEFRILNTISTDTRIGEDETETHSVTADFNALSELESNSNTLLLLHFNDEAANQAVAYDRYATGFETAPSVNDQFSSAIRLDDFRPYVLSNTYNLINNDQGTIEFWVNPLEDSRDDKNYRYYIDMSSDIEEEVVSTNQATLAITNRAASVSSVRLVSDVYNEGINYFAGGELSNSDSKTITLGTSLPLQNTKVKVVYTPIDSNGDRLSVYRDPDGRINFYVKATGVEHQISVRVDWSRHTWHRIMVMWKTNSATGQDRLRLFVDGFERGTIKYGTGLVYGTGVVYGQEDVTPGTNRYIVDNIDLTDTFPRVFIGTDVFSTNSARVLIDNIRVSNIERLGSIRVTNTDAIDVDYTSNADLAYPVVSDNYTTKLVNFDTDTNRIRFFSTIINAERGIFRWKCKVIDSFGRIKGNTFLEGLLRDLINKLKGAHTEVAITIVD